MYRPDFPPLWRSLSPFSGKLIPESCTWKDYCPTYKDMPSNIVSRFKELVSFMQKLGMLIWHEIIQAEIYSGRGRVIWPWLSVFFLLLKVFGTEWNVCGIPLDSPASCSRPTFDRFRYNEVLTIFSSFFLSFSLYRRKYFLIQKNTSMCETQLHKIFPCSRTVLLFLFEKTREHRGVRMKSLKKILTCLNKREKHVQASGNKWKYMPLNNTLMLKRKLIFGKGFREKWAVYLVR